MEASTPCQTLRTARTIHAIPIYNSSFLPGFEAHSFWFPRMHAFRLCMAQRSAKKHRLNLPEEVICSVEMYVQAAATLHSIRYSHNLVGRVANARTEAAIQDKMHEKLEASNGSFDVGAFVEDMKQRKGDQDRHHAQKNQDVPSLVQRYLAAVFNLAVIPSGRVRVGRLYPKHLYLCVPWWPVPRGELDLQRWHEEKTAAAEPSDLFAYIGWDAKLAPEVLPADDARAVGPSRVDVARLNHAIYASNLEVEGRKGTVKCAAGRRAARDSAAEGGRAVGYVEDPTTGRKLWQPRRLLFSPVVASRPQARSSLGGNSMQGIC